MPESLQSFISPCMGGLVNNQDPITQGGQMPGSAIRMINYEPSLEGGYRRISGFTNDFGTVPGESDTPVLGVAVYQAINDGIFAARKPVSGNNYFHYWDSSGSSWTEVTTSGSPTMVGVTKVRFTKVNWGVPYLILTDGINPAASWDGTTYAQITGDAPSAPSLSETFSSHLFLAGDPSEPNNVYFSAPNDVSDFTSASGGGVINVGFEVTAIKTFRDQLYVFGSSNIKRVTGTSSADFQLSDITSNLGCVATDSIIEFNGDVLFLSSDGMRPISGTDRIGDVELNSITKPVQSFFDVLYANEDLTAITCVTLSKKTQFRLFLNDSSAYGLIGGIRRAGQGGQGFEFSQLVGMEVSCADSGLIGAEEYVIHGNTTGDVFRQESGQNFNGEAIFSLYKTPFVYMEDLLVRKTLYDINTFMQAEGAVTVNLGITFDFGENTAIKPSDKMLNTEGAAAYWEEATYDASDVYDGNPNPLKRTQLSGSMKAVSFSYVTTLDQPSHTIQAYGVSYKLEDRR